MRPVPQADPPRARWRDGSWLRVVGLLLLVGGLWLAYRHFPTRPTDDWQTVLAFEVDREQCRALREARSASPFTAPAEAEAPVTVAEAARKFKLELPLVCEANDLPPTCGDEQLAPGDPPLHLPLARQRDAVAPPDDAPTPNQNGRG